MVWGHCLDVVGRLLWRVWEAVWMVWKVEMKGVWSLSGRCGELFGGVGRLSGECGEAVWVLSRNCY